MLDLSHDDLVAALRGLSATAGDGSTTLELATALGYSLIRTRNLLREALAAGAVDRCRVLREDLSGRLTTTTGWRARRAA